MDRWCIVFGTGIPFITLANAFSMIFFSLGDIFDVGLEFSFLFFIASAVALSLLYGHRLFG